MARNYRDQGEVVEFRYSAGSTHIEPAVFDAGEPIIVNSLPAISLEPRTSTSTRTVALVHGTFEAFVQTSHGTAGKLGDIIYLHETEHMASLYDYETGFTWGDGEEPTEGAVDTAPAIPNALNQTYYNTSTELWHESEASGSVFVWDSGTSATPGADLSVHPTSANQHLWDGSRWYTSSTSYEWGTGEVPTNGAVDTAPATPDMLGQSYYNTSTDMWHESQAASGGGYEWDSGTAPTAGAMLSTDPTAAGQHVWEGSRWYTSSSSFDWGDGETPTNGSSATEPAAPSALNQTYYNTSTNMWHESEAGFNWGSGETPSAGAVATEPAAPTGLGQTYYNTTTNMWHESEASGSDFVWGSGTAPDSTDITTPPTAAGQHAWAGGAWYTSSAGFVWGSGTAPDSFDISVDPTAADQNAWDGTKWYTSSEVFEWGVGEIPTEGAVSVAPSTPGMLGQTYYNTTNSLWHESESDGGSGYQWDSGTAATAGANVNIPPTAAGQHVWDGIRWYTSSEIYRWGTGELPTHGGVDTAPAIPSMLEQTYYNTTDEMWHESEASGSVFVWDSGTAETSGADIHVEPTAADQHVWDGIAWYTSTALSIGSRWGYLLETIPASVTRKVRVRIGY